jgi:AhpD family alkylhydroperoxidase
MISLAVSQFNDCNYCIALHTTTAIEGHILSREECIEARRMQFSDPQADALLAFTKAILRRRGIIDDLSIEKVKNKGFADQEIVEVIAMIAFISLANYIANVGEPELDFLEPPPIT